MLQCINILLDDGAERWRQTTQTFNSRHTMPQYNQCLISIDLTHDRVSIRKPQNTPLRHTQCLFGMNSKKIWYDIWYDHITSCHINYITSCHVVPCRVISNIISYHTMLYYNHLVDTNTEFDYVVIVEMCAWSFQMIKLWAYHYMMSFCVVKAPIVQMLSEMVNPTVWFTIAWAVMIFV